MLPAPRKPKRDAATETARVLRVFDLLDEELDRRGLGPGSALRSDTAKVLEIADRICARTEEEG